ncbi:hypothetical protein K2224_35355 (plasmid) [Streptomyces sp. BHT-5-2]|uniref:hypothetical protein n=1 Tax=Streptomyces sp. BHT-5-2 TaxID=2866715 RepID=UPI001C8D6B09|nr:hypothetical protein [Streptomyces sp. BHT-5-2]QZL08381.1 hypothetical protein K2224_35355 [Streptomyces sp. BHT-5-2]
MAALSDVATGATTGTYAAEMIENMVENRPYLVIASGVAFARSSLAVIGAAVDWPERDRRGSCDVSRR